MNKFVAALRRSTRQKFAHMARPALYFTDPAATNPKIVMVIITDRFTAAGDQKGTNFNSAELEMESPTIEFLREQIEPARNAFVSVDRGLTYRVDTVLPFEDICITARAARVAKDRLRNYPYPSEALVGEIAINPELVSNQPAVLPAWMKEEW